MLKITDSYVFKSIESEISNGQLYDAMKEINEEAIRNKNALITEANCKALKYFFDGPAVKTCPAKNLFREYLASGKIKLVYMPTSKLQTLVYAFPIQSSSKDTYLIMNATHYFNGDETLTEDGKRIDYTIHSKDDNYIAEIANVSMMILATANSPACVNAHVNTKKEIMGLYATMFTNIILRQGQIGIKTDNAKVIRYLANTFFLKNILKSETPVEVLSGLGAHQADLSSDAKRAADLKISLSSCSNTWYESLEEFVKLILEIFPTTAGTSVKNLVNQFNLSYTPVSVMGLDYLPYVAGLFAATATKNIVFGGASFRNKIDMLPNTAIRAMQEIF